MARIRVGVRELKQSLSHYLRQVAAGNTVLVTDRGRVVGQIIPVQATPEDRLRQLAFAGLIDWSGRRLPPTASGVVNQGGATVADLVLEERE